MNRKKKSEWLIIAAVSLGGILEWYEVGLYIYWPLIVLGDFFNFEIPAAEAINTTLVIATGFIARPVGGLIFGRWGDKKGRKKPFAWSIIVVAIPSLLIAFLPNYVVWSVFSTILFTTVKFLQGIPAGGELPGAICFLAENGHPERRRYLCSYTFVGPQIGLLFSMAICLFMQLVFNLEDLIHFWWRLIFFSSGLIGIFGYYLRKKIHESSDFENLLKHSDTDQHPLRDLFNSHAKEWILGICVSIFQVVTFCVLTIVPSEFYKSVFKLNTYQNLVINSISLFLCVIVPPLIGKISQYFKKIPYFEISALGVLAFSYPFYSAVLSNNLILTLFVQAMMILFYSTQAALLPSLLADLFPVSLRYTGIGCSFNVADGVLWGLIPIFGSILVKTTGNNALFIIFLPVSAIIFLWSYHVLKNTKNFNLTN